MKNIHTLLFALALSFPFTGHADHHKNSPSPPENRKPTTPKLEKRVWLGVQLQPVDPALREHLNIPEGFGILAGDVMKGSPADKAGLRRSDVILTFDDQRLISAEHIQKLVRSMKKGDSVSLNVISRGKEKTLEATLEEVEMPVSPTRNPISAHSYRYNDKNWPEAMKQSQDHWRRVMETHRRNHQEAHGKPEPKRSEGSDRKPSADKEQAPKKAEKEPEKPPAISVRPGFPLQIFGAKGVVKIDNQEGELTLNQEDGKYDIELKDNEGNEVYSGPYDTKSGIEGLPEEAREQLKKMKLDDLELIIPKPESPKKINSPKKPQPKEKEAIL